MTRALQAPPARHRRGFWLVCGLLAAAPAWALDPKVRFSDYVRDNWTLESGLPQISALSITQDGIGYVWIGTQSAIARFDGTRFVVFDRESTGIDTTLASVAYTDRRGEVWFGSAHGALHERQGRFEALRAGPRHAAVQGIAEADDGTLLFATTLGVMRLEQGRLTPALLDGEPCYALLRDAATLWVGGTGVLVEVTNPSEPIRHPLTEPAGEVKVQHLVADQGGLWLGTSAGLRRYENGRTRPSGLDPTLDTSGIESLYRDSDGNLWIGTARFLHRLRPDGTLERIGAEDLVRNSWVVSVYEDRERNLWLGSQTEGLFRLWNGWVRRLTQRDGLHDPFVWSVLRDRHGRILLGTNSDVVRIEDGGVHELVPGHLLPNPAVYELYADDDDRLWIGTRAGLAVFADGRIERPPPLRALDPYQINVMVQTGDGAFWIGTTGGLYRYRDQTLTRIGPAPGGIDARVRAIYPTGPDRLLVGTETGVREVHGENLTTPAWAKPLEGRFVSAIGSLRPGLLGITTLDSGVGLLAGERLILLDRTLGLPSDSGFGLRVVDGWLYVSGGDGVWRLRVADLPDPASGPRPIKPETVLSSSGRDPGSQHIRCCNGGGSARLAIDGPRIWLPSIAGALRLDTEAITEVSAAPPVAIEGLLHAGRWYAAVDRLALPSGPRDVEIDYTGFNFRDPLSLRFRYRLDGYDRDWIEAGPRRAAFYTNLPAGEYRFQVEVSLPNGVRGRAATFGFVLPPRWYEIAAVRVGLVLVAVAVLFGLLRLRLAHYRRQQIELERLIEQRTYALRRSNERLRQANLALLQASETDALSGLRNRRYLLEHIDALLERGRAGDTRPAFLLLDIDYFKRINDQHGHAAGDSVLVQIAQLLQGINRSDDELLRWGGEEFLIVLMRVTPTQALEVAERLRQRIAAHAFRVANGREVRVTASIGFALHPPLSAPALDWAFTLELADAALYRVKQEGRNGCAGLVAGTAPRTPLGMDPAPPIERLLEHGILAWLRPSTPQPRRLGGRAGGDRPTLR